jgi:hypothetical protein
MSIFRGLRQGGVRGGKDQFQWDTVKTGIHSRVMIVDLM